MENKVRPKFEFLDGIRGLSATFVLFYHAQLFTGRGFNYIDLNVFLRPLSIVFSFGHFAVAVFIVLSGFCLAIPMSMSSTKTLKGGFKRYILRRAKRILPPYYIALIFFILLIWFVPILHQRS